MANRPVSFDRVLREWLVMPGRAPFGTPGEALEAFASFLDEASEDFAESGIYVETGELYGENVHNETYLSSVASEAIFKIFRRRPSAIRILDDLDSSNVVPSYNIKFDPIPPVLRGAETTVSVLDEYAVPSIKPDDERADELISAMETAQKNWLTHLFTKLLQGGRNED